MIRYVALGAVVAVCVAFFLGFSSKGPALPSVVMAADRHVPLAPLGRPGSGLRSAATYFVALHPPPPPPAPPPKPVPPPPPDVSVVFRKALTAVLPGPGAIVADYQQGRRVVRTLHIGDIYVDGWKLTALTRREALLTKGREQRRVTFFSTTPPPVVPPVPSKRPK